MKPVHKSICIFSTVQFNVIYIASLVTLDFKVKTAQYYRKTSTIKQSPTASTGRKSPLLDNNLFVINKASLKPQMPGKKNFNRKENNTMK